MVETTSDLQPKASKLASRRWTPDETAALVEAWAPLYNRRRRGAHDAWVPLCIRGRGRASRALVTEDWRAVACAVNSYRAAAGLGSGRTYVQCKKRVEHLRRAYDKGRPLFHALHAVWGAAAVGGRGAPAGDARATAAAGAGADEGGLAEGRAVVDAVFAAAAVEAHGGSTAAGDARATTAAAGAGADEGGPAEGRAAVEAHGGAAAAAAAEGARGVPSVAAPGGLAMGEDFAAAACYAPRAAAVEDEELGSPGGAAATDLLAGGTIPRRPRSAFSGTGRASPPVKEELVQRANARRGAAYEGRGGEAGNGAAADDIAAALAGLLGGALGDDAKVVTTLADMYKQVTMKRLDLERERVAAEAPAAGRPPVMSGPRDVDAPPSVLRRVSTS